MPYEQSDYNKAVASLLLEAKKKFPQDPKNSYAAEFYCGLLEGLDQYILMLKHDEHLDFQHEYLIYKNTYIQHKGSLKEYFWYGFCTGFHFHMTEYNKFKSAN